MALVTGNPWTEASLGDLPQPQGQLIAPPGAWGIRAEVRRGSAGSRGGGRAVSILSEGLTASSLKNKN